jgi:hypothetical protein
MAQAATANTDELLSQLAASEIDRLLNEAEAGNAEPAATAPPPVVEEPAADAKERAAMLEAAGFETKEPAKDAAPAATPAAPVEDERTAILQAAGFESPDEAGAANPAAADLDDDYVPFYLKPLVWMNAPLEQYPSAVKKIMGGAGIVTLFNALAVFAYLHFIKKH